MRKVEIGTEKYTTVFAADHPEHNANHTYQVLSAVDHSLIQTVQFQKGAIKEHGVNGVMNEDLIAMVIDRLESFQDSPFKCRENALAITKFEEGLHWLRQRTTKRENRGVEGTHTV
jgi:hypothetical protein